MIELRGQPINVLKNFFNGKTVQKTRIIQSNSSYAPPGSSSNPKS